MNIILTLDYELYFGKETGSVYKSIVNATEQLLSVLDQYEIKAVFFVDIGFIKKLKFFKESHADLDEDYQLITNQLKQLSQSGHDLQLHIHPHWEDSYYKEGKWILNTDRYRLSDWSAEEINNIVSSYKQFLEQFCFNNTVFAFRAGGWCIQPFEKIGPALKKNNIWLDSTVYKGGFNKSETQYFDFRDHPSKKIWHFEDDPLEENESGSFLEIPISSYKVSPLFFWKLALTKLIKSNKHSVFGDGQPLPASKFWLIKKLLKPSYSTVSIDGYKASLLEKSFISQKEKHPENNFVIIGHPKALSSYSLNKLEQFIKEFNVSNRFTTFSEMNKSGVLGSNIEVSS